MLSEVVLSLSCFFSLSRALFLAVGRKRPPQSQQIPPKDRKAARRSCELSENKRKTAPPQERHTVERNAGPRFREGDACRRAAKLF